MLVALVCRCAGATQRARKLFKNANVPNWLDVPIYEGKEQANQFFSNLPPTLTNTLGAQTLKQHIADSGSYNTIVGFTQDNLIWSSIHNATTQEHLDAQMIAEAYHQP